MKPLSEQTIKILRKKLIESQDGGANYLDDNGETLAQQDMIKDPKVVDKDNDQNEGKDSNDKDPVANKDFKGDRDPDDKGVKKMDPKTVNKDKGPVNEEFEQIDEAGFMPKGTTRHTIEFHGTMEKDGKQHTFKNKRGLALFKGNDLKSAVYDMGQKVIDKYHSMGYKNAKIHKAVRSNYMDE